MIKIHLGHDIECSNNNSIIVVIDVLRAFSVTTAAIENGVSSIFLFAKSEEAFSIRKDKDNEFIAGEIDGLKVDGFNFGNSPTEVKSSDLRNKKLLLRTTNGVRTVVNTINKGEILCASMRNATNTANYIKRRLKEGSFEIHLIATDRKGSDEDLACAEMIKSMIISEKNINTAPYIERVKKSENAKKYYDLKQPSFIMDDLLYCSKIDKFAPATRCIFDQEVGVIRIQVIDNEQDS